MRKISLVITLLFAAPALSQSVGRGPVFSANDKAPVSDGKVMVRLADLQEYRGPISAKLKGAAYFATAVVERTDLSIEEGKMIYDCYESQSTGSLKCDDITYIRPVVR